MDFRSGEITENITLLLNITKFSSKIRLFKENPSLNTYYELAEMNKTVILDYGDFI